MILTRGRSMSKITLGDIGEFGILRDHLIPSLGDLGKDLGDDCVVLDIVDGISLVLSSDRGVRPLAWSIEGMPIDFADAGWLAVVASASDLATAGARPFAITNDIEAPETMRIEDLNRFAVGVSEACRAFQFRHGGGDLAQAGQFGTHCTAIGLLRGGHRVGRHQCRPDDQLFALGPMGALASSYLHALRQGPGALSLAERQALLRPKPQLGAMQMLVERKLVHAASDCSDGVLGALLNLSEASGFGIELTPNTIKIPAEVVAEATASNLSPWNLFFFWGDWQVVAATTQIEEVLSCVGSESVTLLGRVVADKGGGLTARVGSHSYPVPEIRNENFRQKGYVANLDEHIRLMLETRLF